MEKNNTKQEILNVALDMFSQKGYEATSVFKIAEAVGIRKASLYSHFASKQEILDALMKSILEQYEKRSLFAHADWNDPLYTKDKENITCDIAIQMITGQVRYIIHDESISRARKMLIIGQYQNSQMASLQTKQNYTDVMKYFVGFINFLIQKRKLKEGDAEIMAAQLALPITVWINLCDREPEREAEVMMLIERHIRNFFETYQN